MKKVDNIFFLDEPVSEALNKIKNGVKTTANVLRAGDSFIATKKSDNEKATIIFRPNNVNFTYEVNGHFYGTFFFEDDKIVVKWPIHLKQRDKQVVVNEVQEFFRRYL